MAPYFNQTGGSMSRVMQQGSKKVQVLDRVPAECYNGSVKEETGECMEAGAEKGESLPDWRHTGWKQEAVM